VREAPGVDALEFLVRQLAGAERVLVLDNCEHLLGACAALVDRLVRGAGALRILATSREPLGVAGETSWRIPSLAVPAEGEGDLERLAQLGAVQLFVARAQAARNGFALDAATAPLVARICRRLDGIPLALELAAARVRTLSLDRLAEGLDDRFRLLTGGSRTAVERQRTLLASVEWSHDLLDEEERTLFRRLSVFAAPFTVDAAEAVAADEDIDAFAVLDLLAHLVDKSLVAHDGDRYRMLETIRQYAQVRSDEARELELLRDRHLEWFQSRAESWGLHRDVATLRQLAEVSLEMPDLVAAAEWSAARHRRLPSALMHALGQTWGASDRFHEACTVGRRLLGALEPDTLGWLEGLAPLANLMVLGGDLAWQEPARRLLDGEPPGLDPVARGFVECALWLPAAYFGSSEALARVEAAAELGRELGNVCLEASVRVDLAILRAQTGDPAGARPLIAWLDRHVARDAWMASLIRGAHALTDTYDGDFRAAHRQIEVDDGSLVTQVIAGVVHFWECNPEGLRGALARTERLVNSNAFAGAADVMRGQLALLAGDLDGAARAFESAPPGMLGSYVWWLEVLRGEVALSRGEVGEAEQRVRRILEATTDTELHYNRACGRILAAHLARRGGELLEAESLAHAALADAVAHGMSIALTDALELLAVLAGERGDVESAGRLLGATTAFRERSGYRWSPAHQREARETVRGMLPAAALAEGAGLSLAEAASYASRGRGERGRPDHGWESLTPSELRVVEEVAAGLSNAAVAKKLFVSLATVKTHLVHTYAKLGLTTRPELVAAATKRRLTES
jgi:predicted ATPase/DNA-binding CsgD family transcriptional regulator